VQNVYYFRDRVIRETQFKLFVGTDRKPEKLVDLSKDPEEKNNLINNPEYAEVLKRLAAVIPRLPEKDHDPIYRKLPAQAWDKKAEYPGDVHKIGHPEGGVFEKKRKGKK